MDWRKAIIKSSEAIDGDILNDLSYGIDIHILSTNHMVCEGDNVMFTKYIHNNDPSVRVIFIPDSMKHEFKMIENVYYTESRRGMDPCPRDPLERFKWYCPLCGIEFDTM